MYKDNQGRVDAYLRGEMDSDVGIQFERDLKSDVELAKVYRETKAISDAIADRKEKLNMMDRWDKEEDISQRLIRRRNYIRRWTIGMSAAACIAIGFFAIRPMFLTTSYSPTSDFVMPNFGNETYYRGGDSSMEYLDSLISVKNYETALTYADSLINSYDNELRAYETKDSLSEKEAYNKEMCEYEMEDLEWRKANLLIALGKTNDARKCLKKIITYDSFYKEQADSLLNTSPLK